MRGAQIAPRAGLEQHGCQTSALLLGAGVSARFCQSFSAQLRNRLARVRQREPLDVLANNAGLGAHAALACTSKAQFGEFMNVQLKGPFFLTQALLPR